MKILFVVFVCALIAIVSCAVTPQEEDLLIEKECMKESGATEEELSDARFKGIFTNEPVLAKHLICLGLKQGVMDADGHVHKDALKKKLLIYVPDEALVSAAVDKCLVEKTTSEETAIATAKCLHAEFSK